MATKLRLAASVFVVVTLVLIGTTAGIAANGNGNGNPNAQPNGNASGNGNTNGNGNGNTNGNAGGNSNSNTNGNGNADGNSNANGNGNTNGNASGNSNSNTNGNGNDNANGNSNANGNENGSANGNGNGNASGKSNGNGNDNENGSANGNGNENGNDNGNGQGAGNTTVTICHNPTGDASTLDVNDDAVPAHLAHGDQLGACAEPPVVEDEGDSQEQETTDEQGNNSGPEHDPAPTPQIVWFGSTAASPSGPRSLYCSTKGPVDRGDGEWPGIALNLLDSQGAFLVEQGLVTPAIFYPGVGVSCDHLPGFVYSGLWVDHVGDVVEGIGVYPYYVPAG